MNIKIRSGVIVLRNNTILLMYRKKFDKVYYTFPGGTVELNETIEQAATRELFEETCISASLNRLLYCLDVSDSNLIIKKEYFFLCDYTSGDPKLSLDAIENQRVSDKNIYNPLWVSLDKIKNLVLYPLEVRDLLIQDLNCGFSLSVKKIKKTSLELRNN